MSLRENTKRRTAFLLLLVFLIEIVTPTISLALTGGPSMPEVTPFASLSTNEMVNPFTGDFSYNIPLMHVPGPNGGYPINLSYNAGIGMDQEASWVGLGWNIDVGAITRQKRGLPDDFDGQEIVQEYTTKPDVTIGMKYSRKLIKELLGVDASGAETSSSQFGPSSNFGLYYNTYTGLGGSFGWSPNLAYTKDGEKLKTRNSFLGNVSLGLNYDTQQGVGINGGYKFGATDDLDVMDRSVDRYRSFGAGISLNSNFGKKNLGVSLSLTRTKVKNLMQFNQQGGADYRPDKSRSRSFEAGVSFYAESYVPRINFETTGWNTDLHFTPSTTISGLEGTVRDFALNYSTSRIKDNTRVAKAYGYLFDEHVDLTDDTYELRDFNQMGSNVVSQSTPGLQPSMNTYDVFLISGQGAGGMIRGYKREIPMMASDKTVSKNGGGAGGVELGTSITPKLGVDATTNFMMSYSGPWRSQHPGIDSPSSEFVDGELNSTTNFYALDPATHGLTENFFFAPVAEQVAHPMDNLDVLRPFSVDAFGIKGKWSGISAKPEVIDYPIFYGNGNATKRRSRNQYHGYKTLYEYLYSSEQSPIIYNLEDGNNESAKDHIMEVLEGEAENEYRNSIGEMYTVNAEGTKYSYALPAYNLKEKTLTFSVNGPTQVELERYPYIMYDGTDASFENTKGMERLYSSQTVPAYAYAYLLTQITSADYVDLTNNGPTQDDLGSYVKFNYTLACDAYGWRTPHGNGTNYVADFLPGYLSNFTDDKATINYGVKEVYYLQSIETKTHKAIFILNTDSPIIYDDHGHVIDGERLDSRGVKGIHGMVVDEGEEENDTKLNYLKSIELYTLDEGGNEEKLIQTTHFSYSYELCPNVENNRNSFGHLLELSDVGNENRPYEIVTSSNLSNSGKLTLKSVWTTFFNNSKGAANNYTFEYVTDNFRAAQQNPKYNAYCYDRWGNFQQDMDNTYQFRSQPYSRQDWDLDNNGEITNSEKMMRNDFASAWSLRKIHLPTGGTIDIDYESDSYSWVQDKTAMEMVKIKELTDNGVDHLNEYHLNDNINWDISGNKMEDCPVRIWFELSGLENQTGSWNMVDRAFRGQEFLYFKVHMKLSENQFDSGDNPWAALDYVEGWAKIKKFPDGTPITGYDATSNCGYIEVEMVDYKGKTTKNKTHPFRRAGWQYMQVERSDLLRDNLNGDDGMDFESIEPMVVNSVFDLFRQTYSLFSGFYRYAKMRDWCAEVDCSKPSYIRVNTYKAQKFGGGARVKKITINDQWSDHVSGQENGIYGQEYFYVNEDGITSSGVAEYEPMIGGEENVFRQPIAYNGNTNVYGLRHDETYLEEPLCEGFFPTANVGYQRVVVKQFRNSDSQIYRNAEGITELKYYTAKDYPIETKRTGMDPTGYNIDITIPMLGRQSFHNNGYSQGFLVVLNDMHGKMRSTATYPYLGQDLDDPSEHITFFSNVFPETRTKNFYHSKSEFTEGVENELKNVVPVMNEYGVLEDAYLGVTTDIHLGQEQNSSWFFNVGIETNVDILNPVALPTIYPVVEYSEAMYRSITAAKVTHLSGVLDRVETQNGASTVITKNEIFDAGTGMAILTSVNNNYDQPIYNYNIPAYWNYRRMGSAAINEGATFSLNQDITLVNATELVFGDNVLPAGVLLGQYFVKGDVLEFYPSGTKLWVEDCDNINTKLLVNGAMSSSFGDLSIQDDQYFKIIRSGYRNQKAAISGSIVALDNPIFVDNVLGWINTNLANSSILEPIRDNKIQFKDECEQNTYTMSVDITPQVQFNFGVNFPGTLDYNFDLPVYWYTEGADQNATINSMHNALFYWGEDGNMWCNVPAVSGVMLNVPVTLTGIGDLHKFNPCEIDVLQTNAVTYSDDWTNALKPNEKLETDPEWEDMPGYFPDVMLMLASNPYRCAALGTWRPDATYVYQIDRKQVNFEGNVFKTNSKRDGLYQRFRKFNWLDVSASENDNWTKASEMKYYSIYGNALEDANAIGISSAALYGVSDDLVLATGSNASSQELAFESFEDVKDGEYLMNGATFVSSHLPLMIEGGGAIELESDERHSGRYSLRIPDGAFYELDFSSNGAHRANMGLASDSQSNATYFIPKPDVSGQGKRYIINGWFKTNGNNMPIVEVRFIRKNQSPVDPVEPAIYTSSVTNVITNHIDGWRQMELDFVGPSDNWEGTMTICFKTTNGDALLWDDIRIQPFNSEVTCFVYDPLQLRLLAVLDPRNFATFYNYDEEGSLVQTKKETERGIYTLQTGRNNLKAN